MKNNIRERLTIVRSVFAEIGPLRSMLWISFGLVFFQALWTGTVLSALGAFLQLALGSLQGSVIPLQKTPTLVRPLAALFLKLPESRRLYLSFGIMGLMMFLSTVIKVGVFSYQLRFSTQYIYRFREKVF